MVNMKKLGIIIVIISSFFLYSCGMKKDRAKITKLFTPFEIEISDPNISEENDLFLEEDSSAFSDLRCRRMRIQVTINNTSGKDLKNVWFELSLNEEAEPYIASHIISFKSDKMDVTTPEKAQLMDDKGEIPQVSGFVHNWDMLLTTSEDLEEYYNLEPEGVMENLKSITVKVHWDGGAQEYIKLTHFE